MSGSMRVINVGDGCLCTNNECADSSSPLSHWLFQYSFGIPSHTFDLA